MNDFEKKFGSVFIQNIILALTCFFALLVGVGQCSINKSLENINQQQLDLAGMPVLMPYFSNFTYDLTNKSYDYELIVGNSGRGIAKNILCSVQFNGLEMLSKNDKLSFENLILVSGTKNSFKARGLFDACQYLVDDKCQNIIIEVKVNYRNSYNDEEYCSGTYYAYSLDSKNLSLTKPSPFSC